MPFARQRLNRGHLAPTTVELDKRNPVLHHVPSDEKVLERRDVEIAGAWDSFVGAASKHAVMLKQQSNARRGHPIPASRNGAAELSGVYDRKLRQLMKRYGGYSSEREMRKGGNQKCVRSANILASCGMELF